MRALGILSRVVVFAAAVLAFGLAAAMVCTAGDDPAVARGLATDPGYFTLIY